MATTCELLHNRNSETEVIEMDRVSRLHNVPKYVLGRSTHLHTDMKAHGSHSDPADGGESYRAVCDNVHLKWNKCKMEKQLPLNGPWNRRISMQLDKLDTFSTGLPMSKGGLQWWGATRLEHQAIRHHLPEITTTDYSANTVIVTHSIHALSEIFRPKGTPWRAGQVYQCTSRPLNSPITIYVETLAIIACIVSMCV